MSASGARDADWVRVHKCPLGDLVPVETLDAHRCQVCGRIWLAIDLYTLNDGQVVGGSAHSDAGEGL